jgi:hypothetical protein
MVQMRGDSLQEFSAAFTQLDHWSLVRSPKNSVQRQAVHAFIDGVKNWEMKQQHLIDSYRLHNEALNQALKLETAKAAAGSPVRLRYVTKSPHVNMVIKNEHCMTGRSLCYSVGMSSQKRLT